MHHPAHYRHYSQRQPEGRVAVASLKQQNYKRVEHRKATAALTGYASGQVMSV